MRASIAIKLYEWVEKNKFLDQRLIDSVRVEQRITYSNNSSSPIHFKMKLMGFEKWAPIALKLLSHLQHLKELISPGNEPEDISEEYLANELVKIGLLYNELIPHNQDYYSSQIKGEKETWSFHRTDYQSMVANLDELNNLITYIWLKVREKE